MRAINLDTYSLSLLTAKEDILNQRASTDWALFTYDGVTNNLKLFDSGAGGLAELVEKFHPAKSMYGLCRVGLTEGGEPRIILICWVGENVDEIRQTECESHVPAVRNFFKEAHTVISTSNKDEWTEEKIGTILAKVQPQTERFRRNSRPTEKEETVGTNYRKTNAALEIKRINRDSFWARAEREEEERKDEEKKRAAEDRRRRERERVMQEKKDAEERDKKMNEKLQMVKEQRRLDAQLAEESRRHEKAQWELQQREFEEEMRARLRRSESIEKAAEAAALISQRSMNPREFFRQLSSSSLTSSSPASPRSGKPPFRRYQRSLTDTAFIFERANSFSGPTSPLSPSVNSPFSRTPSSPFNRSGSPTSPSFRPITSPHSPRAPIRSPPTSPPVSSPPIPPVYKPPPPQSSLPVLPASNVSAGLVEIHDVRGQEPAAFPHAPDVLLPGSPVRSKDHYTTISTQPKVDEGVLVEEDEEEEELPAETDSIPYPNTKTSRSYQDVVEPEESFMPRSEPRVGPVIGSLFEVEEPTDLEQDIAEETEIDSGLDAPEPEALESEEPTLIEDPEDKLEVDITADIEIHVAASKNRVVEEERPAHNGVYPQNGTDKEYDDSSEHSTPERCTYIVNREDEEDDIEDASENEEFSGRSSLCVRALYDYQAEDDTEISFEPGDIINNVETIDKAWWRGFSKDGHQGLFPANYVETI